VSPSQTAQRGDRGAELQDVERIMSLRGCRVTRQRRAIVAQFAQMRRYVTPQQLYESLAGRRPRIGLATVYRTLDVLEQIGAAARAPGQHGEHEYLFCPVAHHHHAVCVKCGAVDDVPCRSVERFARSLAQRMRFRLTQHRLEFYGLCERCS
jgi:Fur family transcriptional regulator, ferric uptake regulator